jgi:hypothetical protein
MTTAAIIRKLHAVQIAQDIVRPYAGLVDSATSANGVYREALRRLGHDVSDLPGAAAKAMWPILRDQDKRSRRIAMDGQLQEDIATKFPGVAKLKNADGSFNKAGPVA